MPSAVGKSNALLIFNALICVLPESVLSPAIVWLPDVLTTVPSTCMSSAFAVIPDPPTTLRVTAPAVPPPVKPSPAPTAVMSAELVFVIDIILPELDIAMPEPAWNVTTSSLLTTTFPVVGVTNFHAL